MIIESDFPHPQPSFPFPVDPIVYEPGAEPLVCVKFNAHYLPYILGSLLQLALRSTWDTEVDSDAQLQLMRVNDLILLFQRASEQCGITTAHIYEEMSEMPAFRVDCDCNVFVQCCDGTEVQLAKLSDVPKSSTPSDSNTQPAAGGGTAQYCQTMSAQGKLLLPTTVNTGDIITLESATGAGNDGVEAAWRCVDGSQFFAGACVGFPHTDGADPVPTANHMALIVVVGGTPHAFVSGSFTVPGGITNAEAYIQVNDSTLLGNFGSYQICAQVQNNQAALWEKVFDFTASPHSDVWSPYNSGGVSAPAATWIGGTGWSYSDYTQGGSNVRASAIVSATHIDHLLEFILEGNYVYGFLNPGTPYVQVLVNGTPIFTISDPTAYPDGAKLHDIPADVTSVTGMLAFFESFVSNTSRLGSCVISKITLRGTGVNPFV